MLDKIPSDKATLTGAPINPLPTTVPYSTISLCPECSAKVEARVLEKDGVTPDTYDAKAARPSASGAN